MECDWHGLQRLKRGSESGDRLAGGLATIRFGLESPDEIAYLPECFVEHLLATGEPAIGCGGIGGSQFCQAFHTQPSRVDRLDDTVVEITRETRAQLDGVQEPGFAFLQGVTLDEGTGEAFCDVAELV